MEKFCDVRNFGFKDLSEIINDRDNLDEDTLLTLIFNENTNWKNSLTDNNLPQKIIELGKTRGLGIEDLHKEGILGNDTIVAIIDQPLDLNHPEYKNKIIAYKNFAVESESSMHGPAVTSLLVGNTIGVAPGAKVVYAAVPSWFRDAMYEVKALEWIIEYNKKLPNNQKIKFVSVSAAPSSIEARSQNADLWESVVEMASQEKIEVIDCTQNVYNIGPAYYGDIYNKDYFENIKPGFPSRKELPTFSKKYLLAPSSLRTVAEAYGNNIYGYTYCGQGGLSWTIPFVVGTLLLGSEVNKKMTAKDLIESLYDTRFEKEGFYYINPKAFLNLVKDKDLYKDSFPYTSTK